VTHTPLILETTCILPSTIVVLGATYNMWRVVHNVGSLVGDPIILGVLVNKNTIYSIKRGF